MNKNIPENPSRRKFIRNTSMGSALWMINPFVNDRPDEPGNEVRIPASLQALENPVKFLDLSPAKWIWYPSGRTLPNTVLLFRKSITIRNKITSAKAWLVGESRYHLYVNDNWLGFGPAPCDPRYTEADRVDFGDSLKPGKNFIGLKVLYYGFGEGTWPIGKPGLIFRLDIEYEDQTKEVVFSDHTWECLIARSWKPGQYKRWYLRAFQEEFDARLFPHEWLTGNNDNLISWNQAMELDGPADKPALCNNYYEYLTDIGTGGNDCNLRERMIPPIKILKIPVEKLAEKKIIKWKRPVEEYFEMVTPGCYEVTGEAQVTENPPQKWSFQADPVNSVMLTFEFREQIVGFPYFTIHAPAGTTVEIMFQEGHNIGNPQPVMNNHFNSWMRLICREGENYFRAFDYESIRWMQLLIRNASGTIIVTNPGLDRRMYPWPELPEIKCDDPELDRVFRASINTLYNSAQESVVDGMGRERQQYSGDGGHQLHGIYYALGDSRLPARFITTYSQGLTKDGYFMDSWPAYDRMARIPERQLDLTSWGPILDHSVGFNFDSYYYYLYTGDLSPFKEVFPKLIAFKNFLKKSVDPESGLLPVENLGIPVVWIDHDAYKAQRDKTCVYNLYAAAMLEFAFLPLCKALNDDFNGQEAKALSMKIRKSVMENFWSENSKLLIINKPWLAEDEGPRLCDRSLALAVMYDLVPEEGIKKAISTLADVPPNLGMSYPANTGWRYWALAKGGKMDVVIHEFKTKWANLESVLKNNTLQEGWTVEADSYAEWSHCPISPLYLLYMGILGIHPDKPGFEEMTIWPQLDTIESLQVNARTVKGPVYFNAQGKKGNRSLELRLPAGTTGKLKLDIREKTDLELIGQSSDHYNLYKITPELIHKLKLKYT